MSSCHSHPALDLPSPGPRGRQRGKTPQTPHIGNSFANDATAFLPALAQAGHKELVLLKANLGGCSLERHARHLKAYEANPQDPEGSPYQSKDDPSFSLPEALKADTWNYITIQQLSNDSFKPETFESHAGELVAAIKKHAPQAEILIHQTWAYREDYPGYKDGFTQEKMFAGLQTAYGQLSSSYGGLRLIPSGTAFQAARATPRWHFTFPDPAFNYKNPEEGAIPEQQGT